MQSVLVKDVQSYNGQEVSLRGWVYNLRSSGKIWFLLLRDGTGLIQGIVSRNDVTEEVFNQKDNLTQESAIRISGLIHEDKRAPGGYEIIIKELHVYQVAKDYPIALKEHGAEFLMDNRHLWLRSRKQWALLRIRHTVYYAITQYLNENNFIRFDSPILTPNACEGTTTLFEVPYFDLGKAYLSQSGQLYLETGIMSLGRVYDFGPVFRAEKSKTRKHLTEFWMMDAEAAFVEHEENMRIQEGLIRFVIRKALTECKAELEILERNVEQLEKADAPFKIMTHREAVEYLRSKGSSMTETEDLGAQDESLLTESSDVPIFIEKWPKEIKAFYMKRDPQNPDIVLGDDLIAPEGYGEIIGGSQREDDYDLLLQRMIGEKMPLAEYQWFLDLRKYGSVPHSGFGVGLERLVTWIAGVPHIRETIPFPRTIYRLRP
ncbi:MAG: asparagine--tRNA ligase [Candidatus Marinimicrobia bacterium]|jgi:asparaginyl-tRNA synthetase|nr:asparagine--tRNA ligase [Candidatus Neomarinimicrobiota bacterium]MCK9559486.1 asparagine--tRNA ligase [Candidatus Neomarinimicrobiota bacterium]MDD5061716.1 asparagine--tRNA ligase [Candidatus Neomarinimicrobiota bacterium]